MSTLTKLKKFIFAASISAIVFNPLNVFAAETEENSASVSAEQEQAAIVEEPQEVTEADYAESEESEKAVERQKDFNVQNAVKGLNEQIAELKAQIEEQQNNQGRIWELVERLENLERERVERYAQVDSQLATDLSGHLVYPDENYDVRYTQDAANSQGNSTVIFRYAPNQLYKIYCRVGYLTDLSLSS